jgi:hypothetical protein
MPWEAPVYWTHPEGEFPAQLTNWEEITSQFKDEKTGELKQQIKWTFETEVERPDGKPPQLSKWTSTVLSPQSKAGEIILALGFEVPAPADVPSFDADALIGSKCIIDVDHKKMPDESVFARIVGIRPIRKQATGGFQAGANPKGRTLKTAPDAAAAGCPDPSYDHSLKPGKHGFDPFHSESCPLMETVTV